MYWRRGAEAKLAMGREPRMNLDALFAVFEEARQLSKRHELVVVGSMSILIELGGGTATSHPAEAFAYRRR